MKKRENTMVDKGWEQMNAILDNELPVDKSKDRLLWLLLAALMLVSSAFLWYYINTKELKENLEIAQSQNSTFVNQRNNNESISYSEEDKSENIIAYELNNTASSVSKGEEGSVEMPKNLYIPSDYESSVIDRTRQSSQRENLEIGEPITKADFHNEIFDKKSVLIEDGVENMSAYPRSISSDNKSETSDIKTNESEYGNILENSSVTNPSVNKQNSVTASIASLEYLLNESPLSKLQSHFKTLEIDNSRNGAKVAFELGQFIQTTNNLNYSKSIPISITNAQVVVNLSRKWKLNSGLSYSFYKLPTNDQNLFKNSSFNQERFSFANESVAISSLLNLHVHAMNFNVGAEYLICDAIGIQFESILKKTWNDGLKTKDKSLATNSNYTLDKTLYPGIKSGFPRHFNVAGRLGVNYHINKHFSLNVHFEQDFIRFSPQRSESLASDFNLSNPKANYSGIGLKYHL